VTGLRRRDRAGAEPRMLSFARAITAHPKAVLGGWLVLVVLATPFALRTEDVLSQQGASKLVPGTESAEAADVVRDHFPARSEREVAVVLDGWTAGDVRMRELLAVLDGVVRTMESDASVVATGSAYTVLRDGVESFVKQQLAAAGLEGPRRATRAELAALSAGLAQQRVPEAVRDLVLASQAQPQSRRRSLAGDFVVATDWDRLPATVPLDGLVDAGERVALVSVSFDPRGPDPGIPALREAVSSAIGSLGLQSDVTPQVTGEIPLLQDTYAAAEADNTRMEQVAYLVILVVLVLFFRALVPAVLTVVMIGLAMNVSGAWLYLVGTQVHLTQFTATIMSFVMLGAGVDYSMLLSSRYRQERLAGRSVHDAAVHATARAGETVLLAGAAVVLSFGATLLAPVDWIPPLGYGGLVGIPVILLAALTITPALLVLLGDRFFALGVGQLGDLESRGALSSALRRTVAVTRRQPVLVVLVFVALTVPAVMTVSSNSLSADPLALSPDTDSRRGAERVVDVWGASALFPTVVVGELGPSVVEGGRLTGSGARQLDSLVEEIAADPGVAKVWAATRPLGSAAPTEGPSFVGQLPDSVTRDYLSEEGAARIVVALRGDPLGDEARATIDRLDQVVGGSGLSGLRIGGTTAVDQEYDEALRSSFWSMVTLVSVGVFLLLLVALRSLLIPVRLILTIMMSNVWAVAVTFVVFRVVADEAVINDLPIFLVILMMGLGMDYEIFLITRVRDLVRRGYDDARAAGTAVVDTGRVITAAGLVMAGSLGTMMLSSTLMLQQYGLGLGLAVLLDATAIRMFLVPASLLMFRRFNWWLPSPCRTLATS
jgi:putative drug exporter of the RND superfamily